MSAPDTYNAGLANCQFGINPGVHWSNCPQPDRCQIHGPVMRVVVGLADGREPYGPDTEPTAITPVVLGLLVASVVWLAGLSANRYRHRLMASVDVEEEPA